MRDVMNSAFLMVYCTVPDAQTGKAIAETLVKEGLCACVNRVPGLSSHYIYEGEYCEDSEELLLIKTTAEAFDRLRARIEALHPYDVPEIIATDIVDGNESYLAWLKHSVK
jgi:periplasmic divalent cation tolerance protein